MKGIAGLLVAAAVLSGSLPVRGAQSPEMSRAANQHLTEIIEILQRSWLYRSTMDWDTLRQRAFAKAGAAQTIPETFDAIRLVLTLLGDKHTYYVTPTYDFIFNPESPTESTRSCTPSPAVTPDIPVDVGYLRVRADRDTSPQELQDTLRKGVGARGWIVDLRNTGGGSTWSALAGVGPLVGEGITGFFVDAANRSTPWGYTNGVAWLQRPQQDLAFIEAPYKLLGPSPAVAVLTDIGVANSGEALAIAFRGRPNTRSFGTGTCGLSTAVAQVSLSRGGWLGVVTSVMADRTMKKYGGVVEPDELVTNPVDVVPRAIAWLRSQ